MPSSDRTLTLNEVQLIGGPECTGRRLERWHHEDVLPRRCIHLGRGRGTRIEYPPGSVEQLQVVQRIMKTHRNFDQVRVLLWCEGFSVPTSRMRSSLLALLPASPVLSGRGTLFERALRAIERQLRIGSRTAAAFTMSARVPQKAARNEAAAALLTAALGGRVSFRADLIESEMGEDSLADSTAALIGVPNFSDGGESLDLATKEGLLDFSRLRKAIERSNPKELQQARCDLAVIRAFAPHAMAIEAEAARIGQDIVLAPLAQLETASPAELVVALSGFLQARMVGMTGYEELVSALATLLENAGVELPRASG